MVDPNKLTHFDHDGSARMVDISDKEITLREASAEAIVEMLPATLDLIIAGKAAKGDVLAVARLAGIMAAKKTADLIPLCHPLALSAVDISFEFLPPDQLRVITTCKLKGKTGVEMEAMTAASVAALTVYDMVKAVDRGLVIRSIRLLSKSGGKSGDFTAG